MRYEPRGLSRVNDRRVLNAIFWVLRSGAPWRDLPENSAPYTTCYNRFVVAEQHNKFGRQVLAFHPQHRVADIVQMHERLDVANIAG